VSNRGVDGKQRCSNQVNPGGQPLHMPISADERLFMFYAAIIVAQHCYAHILVTYIILIIFSVVCTGGALCAVVLVACFATSFPIGYGALNGLNRLKCGFYW
jgi:hypothetical protein